MTQYLVTFVSHTHTPPLHRCYIESGLPYVPSKPPTAADLSQMLAVSPIVHAEKVCVCPNYLQDIAPLHTEHLWVASQLELRTEQFSLIDCQVSVI